MTPIDEAAVYGDISRNWMAARRLHRGRGRRQSLSRRPSRPGSTRSTSRASAGNTPISSTASIEANVSAAVAYGFGAGSGLAVECLRLRHDRALPDRRIRSGSNTARASAIGSAARWSSTPSCSAPPAARSGRRSTAASGCDTCSERDRRYFSSSAIIGAQVSGSSSPAEFGEALLIVVVKAADFVGRRGRGVGGHLPGGGEPARAVGRQHVLVQRAEVLEFLAFRIRLPPASA